MVTPVWWLSSKTLPLLASWLTCVRALLGMFNLLELMLLLTYNVLIPCVGKDPRLL